MGAYLKCTFKMFTQRSTHCARRRLSCEQAAMSREREKRGCWAERERGTSATPGSTLCASSFVGFLKRAKEKKPAVERRSEWKSERETTLFYISLMERRSRVSGMTNFICYIAHWWVLCCGEQRIWFGQETKLQDWSIIKLHKKISSLVLNLKDTTGYALIFNLILSFYLNFPQQAS